MPAVDLAVSSLANARPSDPPVSSVVATMDYGTWEDDQEEGAHVRFGIMIDACESETVKNIFSTASMKLDAE